MNAQEIKNILIAYLKAANHEIRIYQEKSIGNAVCDLMTVTNCLTATRSKATWIITSGWIIKSPPMTVFLKNAISL